MVLLTKLLLMVLWEILGVWANIYVDPVAWGVQLVGPNVRLLERLSNTSCKRYKILWKIWCNLILHVRTPLVFYCVIRIPFSFRNYIGLLGSIASVL